MAVQAVLVRISARLLKQTLQHTDERAKLEGELLDGVDVVKCMTWEVGCGHPPPLLAPPVCVTILVLCIESHSDESPAMCHEKHRLRITTPCVTRVLS